MSEVAERRDVNQPLLFECAWEVANKGERGVWRMLVAHMACVPSTQSQPLTLSLPTPRPTVGGIYTVIKTKAPVTHQEYGDRYTLIGPLSYRTAPMEVEAMEPTEPAMKATLQSMRDRGVKYIYGRWLIERAPKVLLFDTGSMYHRMDEWKGDLWNLAGIPTPPNDHETNETLIFGYLVAWFLGEVRGA